VPGRYTARIDSVQLKKLGMVPEPLMHEFDVKPGLEGDIIGNLDFHLKLLLADTVVARPLVRRDSSYIIVHEVSQTLITISKDSYAIQLGAFRNKSNADNLRKNLAHILGRKAEIVIEDNFYKVRINEITSREEVDNIIATLKKNGITEVWVISLKAAQQQLVVTEKQDSVLQVIEMKPFMTFSKEFYKLPVGQKPMIKPVILDFMEIKPEIEKREVSGFNLIRRSGEDKTTIVDRIYIERINRVIDIPTLAAPMVIQTELIGDKPTGSAKVVKTGEPQVKAEDAKAAAIPEAAAARPVPTIAIQVAIFYKKAEALRAQRKISSKLNLPVEIIEQWEFYRVIIPGFFTKEETYRYYPELAGLGYPGVQIIDNGKK
jgi:cobalamin biosynthesis Co2+ chelatase CbiK